MNTALIIEDKEDNPELIKFILEQAGYVTRRVMKGLMGGEQVLTNPPDFIILDIQLPDIKGFEVLQQIRCHPMGIAVPIIAMTSCAMPGDREQLLADGCTGYIEKPIDPMRIIGQIQATLQSAAAI